MTSLKSWIVVIRSLGEQAGGEPMSDRARNAAGEFDEWAREHGHLLRLVWDSFDRDGEWPDAAELTRQHFRQQPRRDYTEIARRMPPSLGRLDLGSNNVNRIVLTPRGLSYVPAAQTMLHAFFALIRRAIERYEDPEIDSVISAGELPNLLSIDPKVARQLEDVAMLDSWVLQPAGGNPGAGDLRLSVNQSAVFVVADAESFEQYLELQLEAWYPDPEPVVSAPLALPPRPDPARVMVVHGRDQVARDDLFNLLRAMGLKPIEWNEAVRATETGTPYTGDAVDAAFGIAQAAVVLCTPDEQVLLREDLRNPKEPAEAQWAWQPRPNVFFEGGIAFTTHPKRTIVLELGKVRVATDLLGRNTIRIGSSPAWRHDLVERLRTAECAIEVSGSQWLTVGAFKVPELVPIADRPSVMDRAVNVESRGPITRGIADKQW